jgi:VIT1/CCC1 family predicted Fe2+/Mn2+ transporter
MANPQGHLSTRTWVSPAIFGTFDGITSLLGVLLGLAGHPALVLPAAVGVGTAEAVGMAAGQWQSESDDGLGAAAVIGAATGAGCIAPALPYAVMHGAAAASTSAALILGITAAIGYARANAGRRLRSTVQSCAILAAVAAVVLAVHLLTPGGGA